jgi:hypothetical protein
MVVCLTNGVAWLRKLILETAFHCKHSGTVSVLVSGGLGATPGESRQPMTPDYALCMLSYNEDVLYYTGQPKRVTF